MGGDAAAKISGGTEVARTSANSKTGDPFKSKLVANPHAAIAQKTGAAAAASRGLPRRLAHKQRQHDQECQQAPVRQQRIEVAVHERAAGLRAEGGDADGGGDR